MVLTPVVLISFIIMIDDFISGLIELYIVYIESQKLFRSSALYRYGIDLAAARELGILCIRQEVGTIQYFLCLLYTSPSPRDA